MLVLTRRQNEKIVLPDLHVTIEVLATKSGAVRLGITAPPEVSILREEILHRPLEEATPGRQAQPQLCLA